MITVLRAELALLRCRWMLIGGVLIAAGFGVITTLANFLSAQPAASSPPGRGTTLEALGAAGGATEAFRVGTGFLGVLVVVVFAARMATGRLHHALVRRRRSPSRRGRLLAVVFRSVPIVVAVGVAWAGPFEHLLSEAWTSAFRLLPGLQFEALAAGGNVDVSYRYALALGALHGALAVAAGLTSVSRRDIPT
jgi:hypothetical protein